MKKNTSYREVLRDRIPKVVNHALIWCKSKERWLDHVYYRFIDIYVSKTERYNATKIVLGLREVKKKNSSKVKIRMYFNFHSTIDWDNLSKAEELYWTAVESWVTWFQNNLLCVQNTYDIDVAIGKDEDYIINEIKSIFCSEMAPDKQEKFATFLYKCVSGN